jgi:hypothetical protein
MQHAYGGSAIVRDCGTAVGVQASVCLVGWSGPEPALPILNLEIGSFVVALSTLLTFAIRQGMLTAPIHRRREHG